MTVATLFFAFKLYHEIVIFLALTFVHMNRSHRAFYFIGLILLLLSSFGSQAQSLQDQYQLKIAKTSEKITVDGALDEDVWKDADIATDFWMSFPVDGVKADSNIRTIVRMTYDDTYIYIAAECMGTKPYIIQSLKRDNPLFWQGDAFGLVFDPVNERTNGFVFAVNTEGVQSESLITGQTGRRGGNGPTGFNTAWDNKWYSETKSFPDRWTTEMAIPFNSLRFGEKEDWGVNFLRSDAKSNSYHTWSPVPVQFRGVDMGYLGKLIWDKAPAETKKNISLIPYALSNGAKNYEEGTPTETISRIGLDAKVAVTSGLNLDLTINPDFSQVDVDVQQTNLTTVNLRFPEQRLFFLENSDVFGDFGIPPMRPFFSRKIGLDDNGNTIPILYGARLSGNINKNLRMAVMNTQTKADELPGNNYSSFAIHQRVLKRSIIKGYFHNRQGYSDGSSIENDYNRIGGLEFSYRSVDGKWQSFGGYGLAFTDANQDKNYYYNTAAGYDGKAFSFYANLSGMGDDYINDFGFIPRQYFYDAEADTTYRLGFDHWYSKFGYTFYPENSNINQHSVSFTTNGDWTATTKEMIWNEYTLAYDVSFRNSSTLNFTFKHEDVKLLFPFGFTSDYAPLPAELYHFDHAQVTYATDKRKKLQFQTGLRYGSFYNGTRREISIAASYRVQPWGNFSFNFVQNDLNFQGIYGEDQLFLVGPKAEVNFSRKLFWTTFLQYNTQNDNFNINSRLQWRYLPMSDLYIVYSDNYFVETFGQRSRGVVLKLNYWLNI